MRMPACFKRIPRDLISIAFLTLFTLFAQTLLTIYQLSTHLPLRYNGLIFSLTAWHVFKNQWLFFLLANLIVAGITIAYVFFLAHYSKRLCSIHSKYWSLFCWLQTFLTLFLLNQYFFPLSFFSVLPLSSDSISLKATLFLMLFIQAILLGSATFACLKAICKTRWGKISLYVSPLLGVFLFLPTTRHVEQSNQPNIIVIGIDSLRPDHIHYLNTLAPATPNIDAYLKESIIFKHAYTPLARTFPAWTSLLTGNYPKTHHARFNLTQLNDVKLKNSLQTYLKQVGYTTLYAIDETRFSNIDKHFGFSDSLQPSIGLNDFLLSDINDNIYTNYLINSVLGHWLFPFNTMNRAAFKTYYPNTFSMALAKKLKTLHKRPLFLAIHLELSHWPYVYANGDRQFDLSTLNGAYLYRYYRQVIHTVDKQFGQVMQILKTNQLLKNSIVVLISDHGDGFKLPNDRLTKLENHIATKDDPQALIRFTSLNQTQGHGTDILSSSQYRIVYAWHLPAHSHQTLETPVSLVDIAPTILDYLKLPQYPTDGISLMPVINNKQNTRKSPIFIETGVTAQAISLAKPKVEAVVAETLHLYALDDKARLFINHKGYPQLVKNKQRAVILDDYLLAYYPNSDKPADWVLVNLTTKKWTLDMHSDFAKQANIDKLLAEFNAFYGDELG